MGAYYIQNSRYYHGGCYFILLDENDFEMAAVILTFLPDEFDLTQQLPAPIEIFNDDIDENREQLFAVTLSVLDAANLDLVDNSINNVSLCRIKDDDRKVEKK